MATTLSPLRRRRRGLLLAVAATLGVTPFAAADTWDNSSGNSLWSTASNWADNTEPGLADAVIFPDPTPLGLTDITLAAGEQARTLTFNAAFQTLTGGLSGGTLALRDGTIAVTNSLTTANIFVPISGTSGLTKSGNGTLNLNTTGTVGSNYTGGVLVTGGKLSYTIDSDFGSAANIVVLSGGTLQGGNTSSRVINIGPFGGTINPLATFTLTTGMTDGGSANPFTVTGVGSGTLALNASSTRSGNSYITGGHVRLNNGAALGTGGDIISDNGSLEIAGGITHSNIIFLQQNGTLRGGGGAAVHNNTIIVQASGSQVFLSGGISSTDTLLLGGPGTNQYSGGSGAKTIVNGAGRITILTGTNDYAGDWQIDSGTLRPTGGLSLGNGTTPVVVNATGTLQLFSVSFGRDVTLNNSSTLAFELGGQSYGTHTITPGATTTFAFKGAGSEILGDAPNDLTGGNAASTIFVTSDTAGDVLTLPYANNYAGNWSINSAATVRITDPNALGTGTSAIGVFSNATLEVGGVTLPRNVNVSNTSTIRGTSSAAVSGTITWQNFGTNTLSTSDPTDTLTIGDAPNDYTGGSSGAINTTAIAGPGTVILPFANNYSGGWRIDAGTLRIGDALALGPDPTAVVVNAGTLEIAGVTLDRALTLNNGAILAGTGLASGSNGVATVTSGAGVTFRAGPVANEVFTIGNAANDLTGGGGTSAITVAGAGKVVLTQSSNYSGKWILSAGSTLEVSANAQLGVTTTSVTLSGGILSTTASFTAARTFTAAGGTFLTAGGTTLTLSSALASGTGALLKAGTGTLAVNVNSSRTGIATINAGTVRMSGAANPLGTGLATVNSGAALELAGATVSDGGILLNDGSTLRATGTSSYSQGGSPQITTGPANVNITVVGASDTLTIGSAIRSNVAAASSSTIHVNGAGALVLSSGGTTASDIFGGSWEQSAGMLRVGLSLGNSINGLGFKNGDARQANTITVNGGTLAVGVLGSGTATPQFLRANVILAGGAIASTNGIDAQFGGDFTTTASTISRVLTFDPQSTTTARTVNLVAGAAGTDNNAATTHWAGTLIVDPGTTTTGIFNINRTGGTFQVDPGAFLQIDQGATVNILGSTDPLSDGADHVDVLNNSTTSFNVQGGTRNIGNLDGSGKTALASNAHVNANRVRQSSLIISDTSSLLIRPSAANTSTSVLGSVPAIAAGARLDLSDNKLIVAGGASAYTAVTGLIASGRNGVALPFWDGGGIVTSQTSATTGNYTSIGVALASDVRPATATATATWAGQVVTGTDTLVMYTYGGDANLDGKLNIDDYVRIDQGIAAGLTGWSNGDFNYDGKINIDDYTTVIDSNIGNQGAAFASSGVASTAVVAVPEPACGAILLLGSLAGSRRRRVSIRAIPNR